MFLNEIEKSSECLDNKNQAKVYKFTMNKKAYVFKHYHQMENNEGRILKLLEGHPSIPQVYEWGLYKKKMYVIMDFCEGKPLDRMTSDVKKQLDAILHHLQKHKVFHHDLNPNHLLIDDKGQIRLIDFGCAESEEYPLNEPLIEPNPRYSPDDVVAIKRLKERAYP